MPEVPQNLIRRFERLRQKVRSTFLEDLRPRDEAFHLQLAGPLTRYNLHLPRSWSQDLQSDVICASEWKATAQLLVDLNRRIMEDHPDPHPWTSFRMWDVLHGLYGASLDERRQLFPLALLAFAGWSLDTKTFDGPMGFRYVCLDLWANDRLSAEQQALAVDAWSIAAERREIESAPAFFLWILVDDPLLCEADTVQCLAWWFDESICRYFEGCPLQELLGSDPDPQRLNTGLQGMLRGEYLLSDAQSPELRKKIALACTPERLRLRLAQLAGRR